MYYKCETCGFVDYDISYTTVKIEHYCVQCQKNKVFQACKGGSDNEEHVPMVDFNVVVLKIREPKYMTRRRGTLRAGWTLGAGDLDVKDGTPLERWIKTADIEQEFSKYNGNNNIPIEVVDEHWGGSVCFGGHIGKPLTKRLYEDLFFRLHITGLRIYRPGDAMWLDAPMPGSVIIILDGEEKIEELTYAPFSRWESRKFCDYPLRELFSHTELSEILEAYQFWLIHGSGPLNKSIVRKHVIKDLERMVASLENDDVWEGVRTWPECVTEFKSRDIYDTQDGKTYVVPNNKKRIGYLTDPNIFDDLKPTVGIDGRRYLVKSIYRELRLGDAPIKVGDGLCIVVEEDKTGEEGAKGRKG